jgi:hypothetical protein
VIRGRLDEFARGDPLILTLRQPPYPAHPLMITQTLGRRHSFTDLAGQTHGLAPG